MAAEDASRAVQAAGWMLSRADRLRVSELAHRRLSQPGAGLATGRLKAC